MCANDEDEFLEIQTHVLKVQINCLCLGCRKKVRKLLKKIEGVYQVSMDVEEHKVTVYGNVDAEIVITKLLKSGKHAELLSPKEVENQENGSETWSRDGKYQNTELLNNDYYDNIELFKWLSDENYQNQVHNQFNNGVRASKKLPMPPYLYESGIDQSGNEKVFKQNMEFESEVGERDKFSTTTEIDNSSVHQDDAVAVGRRENSMMDFQGLKYNFTTMEELAMLQNAQAELAGYRYHYPMTMNPYMQRMNTIENMDNVNMHQPRMVLNHKFDTVPPVSYRQNMNMNKNSYHI